MVEPITVALTALTTFVVKNAPSWYASLRGTLLDKGRDAVIDKGKEIALARGKHLTERLFRLDEKEQLRHLAQALKNATERGLSPNSVLKAPRSDY